MDWVHYLNDFVANSTNSFWWVYPFGTHFVHYYLCYIFKLYFWLKHFGGCLQGLRNISTTGLFMNIYEPRILVLDKEACKMKVLKWNKWLVIIIITTTTTKIIIIITAMISFNQLIIFIWALGTRNKHR